MLNTCLLFLALGPNADPAEALPAGAILRLGPISRGKAGAAISSIAFFPDGKRLATGGHVGTIGGNECVGTVWVWDLATGKAQHRFPLKGVANAALSPDGKLLAGACCEDGVVYVWDAETGKELRRMQGKYGWQGNMPIAFAPDGKTLAVGSHRLEVWDATTGNAVVSLPAGEPVSRLAFTPDGKFLVFSCVDGIKQRQFRTSNWQEQDFPWPNHKSFAFSVDGALVALEDGLYHRSTGKKHWTLGAKTPDGFAFSPDGRMVARIMPSLEIDIWETATGEWRRRLTGHAASIGALAFSRDGRRLASGGGDGTVLVWDLFAPPPGGELETAWQRLAVTEGDAAPFYAMTELLAAPQRTIAILQARLKPAAPPPAEPVRRLIVDLESDVFDVREAASRQLEKVGPAAIPPLRQVLRDQPALETRQRVEAILDKLLAERLPAATLQTIRAIEVLEHLATPEARRLLAKLSQGEPGAPETEAAIAALRRLAMR